MGSLRDVLLTGVCTGLLVACSGGAGPAPVGPSVLLVTVDTLRADFLEPYGHPRPTSPAIDAFAAQSVVFEDAQASSSWTLPTLASLMTSLYSSSTGCWSYHSRLDPSFTTLAELLRAEGYDTAAVVSHVFLGRPYGLHQGFTHFDDELVLEMFQSHAAVTSPTVTAKGLEWLRHKADAPDGKPWFLWLHYFDPHKEYRQHVGFSEPFGIESDSALYEGEIAFTDRAIGEVLAAVDELGLQDEVVVVLAADHGEEFQDHGGADHGLTLYREVVRVPLIVRAPGFAPRRVADMVRTIDLAPTLLELCGLERAPVAEGKSLVGAMRTGAGPGQPALAELMRSEPKHFESLTDGRWKLIRQAARGESWLYDLEADPTEQVDVAEAHPDVRRMMLARLDQVRGEAQLLGQTFRRGERGDLTPTELEALGHLGYTGDEE